MLRCSGLSRRGRRRGRTRCRRRLPGRTATRRSARPGSTAHRKRLLRARCVPRHRRTLPRSTAASSILARDGVAAPAAVLFGVAVPQHPVHPAPSAERRLLAPPAFVASRGPGGSVPHTMPARGGGQRAPSRAADTRTPRSRRDLLTVHPSTCTSARPTGRLSVSRGAQTATAPACTVPRSARCSAHWRRRWMRNTTPHSWQHSGGAVSSAP